jgi:hypothetical protein
MADKEQATKSPTVVRGNEAATKGITITDKQRESGAKVYFTPPQEGVDVAVSVKSNSLEQAQKAAGITAPVDTVSEPTDTTGTNQPNDEQGSTK